MVKTRPRRWHIGAVALLSASTVYLIPLLIFGYPTSLAVLYRGRHERGGGARGT